VPLFRLCSVLARNGQFHNCQSLSFLTVHGQFWSNRLGLYCQLTIWTKKIQKKIYFLFVLNLITKAKKICRMGRNLKFVELSINWGGGHVQRNIDLCKTTYTCIYCLFCIHVCCQHYHVVSPNVSTETMLRQRSRISF